MLIRSWSLTLVAQILRCVVLACKKQTRHAHGAVARAILRVSATRLVCACKEYRSGTCQGYRVRMKGSKIYPSRGFASSRLGRSSRFRPRECMFWLYVRSLASLHNRPL